jgi:glutamate synthase domain-containing protein 2
MLALSTVVRIFGEYGITDDVTIIASGRLGLPERGLQAFAIGADMVNVGREAMLAVGCIQAQRCHTGHCPTGVATQSKWLTRGVDPTNKSERVTRYLLGIREEILRLARAAGARHPAELSPDDVALLNGHQGAQPVTAVFGLTPTWSTPAEEDLAALWAEWPLDRQAVQLQS